MSATVEKEIETASTALVPVEGEASGSIAAFASHGNFVSAQRIAKALSSSSLVPKEYQGNGGLANCLVAMELASRTGASVLMVMQNLHVIQGRPSWSSAFLVACVNSCGRFSPLRYEFEGMESKAGWKCRAMARDLGSGDTLYGTWITWEMVNAEGWLSKSGSKWKTMPEQMMRYRAAAFWVRAYAPELSLGMHASDELADITARPEPRSATATADLNAALGVLPAADTTATREPCQTCSRSDGTHDPAFPCYSDPD